MVTKPIPKASATTLHPIVNTAPDTASDAYLRALLLQSPDVIAVLEANGTIKFQSPSVKEVLGYEPNEMIGRQSFDLLHPDDFPHVMKVFADLGAQPGKVMVAICRFRRKDGSWCPLECIGKNLLDDPLINGILISSRDNAQQRLTEERLRESEERYSLAMQGTNDGLWDWNLKTNEVYFSPRWKAMLGYADAEIGSTADEWLNRVHREDVAALQAAIGSHIENQTSHYEGEYRVLHKDGVYRWMVTRGIAVRGKDGTMNRLVGSQADITDKKRIAEMLVHDALHDALTKLPNRTLFVDRLQNCLSRGKRNKEFFFAVLFLDLDRFKVVNDGLGHVMGDKLLIEMASLLTSCVRPEDTVARIGGDEFTILLDGITDSSDAIRVAQRIQTALTVPFALGGQDVFTTVSIGIALSASGYSHPEELIRDADNAMYRAKSSGKARHQVFDSSMHAHAVALLQLETDLRRAVERQEFRVHYQAIRSLHTGEVKGFEALVRWQHPQRGLIYPGDFIHAAEETGLIVPIGWWVLNEACRQTAEWHKTIPEAKGLTINVNLSSNQFAQPDLSAQIQRALKETGLSPASLKLEITETVVIENPEAAGEILRQLRELGIKVCLDDFGTGYSSLSYLLRFPIDTLKIDRSFVSGIGTGTENASIVKTIVALAHNMGMDVTAEGVETREQMLHLQHLNCENAQGYLFSKPVSPERAFDVNPTVSI
ncbi:MAG: diguanylate cyclase/phosphodiesterase with sensor(s) [Acidobacteriales bacterium]|nr:diguanylate cyclase/phosphodiesterase with sensor(s) [Terriglobales bacterium]